MTVWIGDVSHTCTAASWGGGALETDCQRAVGAPSVGGGLRAMDVQPELGGGEGEGGSPIRAGGWN